uniref:Putative c2h2-type zn-finger protein n=1 Tax=Culex tarsalis TaxID=7177 RepID=A0A1Q3EWN7_CULTA
MDKTTQKLRSRLISHQFCSFCLRARLPNVEFYEHIVGSSNDLLESLNSLLGHYFRLGQNFAICKPCWKITQLFQDFRLRCEKANRLVEHIGLGLASGDDWFSERCLTAIESIRTVVKNQLQEIEKLAEYASEEVSAVKKSDPESGKEPLESTMDIYEIKIEPDEVTEEAPVQIEKPPSQHEFGPEVADDELSESITNAGGKPHKCRNNCGKGFSYYQTRRVHERKCAQEVYQCNLCEVQQDCPGSLRDHYRLAHPGERKHPCQYCDKRFNIKSLLKRHETTVHLKHSLLTCQQCGKKCADTWTLRMHMRVHDPNDLSLRCSECEKKFHSKSALQMHLARKHPQLAPPIALKHLAKIKKRQQVAKWVDLDAVEAAQGMKRTEVK